MNKKEFQSAFRESLRSMGFVVRGNYSYKIIDDDYLVGVWLDHHPYEKAYYIEYGVVYQPDERHLPFNGLCDWSMRFVFPTEPAIDLTTFPVEELRININGVSLCDWFEYKKFTEDDLKKVLSVNISKRLTPLFNKDFVLDLYRNNWILFRMVPYETVHKICALTGLDADEVIKVRDSRITKWPL